MSTADLVSKSVYVTCFSQEGSANLRGHTALFHWTLMSTIWYSEWRWPNTA